MLSMRLVIVGIIGFAAAGASAQSFEQQLSQFSHNAAVMTRQSRQTFLNAQAQVPWYKIAGIDGSFSIFMPAAAQYSTRTGSVVDLGHGEYAVPLHYYAANHLDRLFAVETVIFPAEMDYFDDYSRIIERMAMIEKNLGGKNWTDIKWKQHQGRKAVDAVGLVGGAEFRVLITAKGKQVFTAFYNGPVGTARSIEVNYFVGSLNIP